LKIRFKHPKIHSENQTRSHQILPDLFQAQSSHVYLPGTYSLGIFWFLFIRSHNMRHTKLA
jgi:hypothetical protein